MEICRCRKEPFAPDAEHHASMLEEQKQKITYEQVEARCAKDGVQYSNMTPKHKLVKMRVI